MTPEQLTGLGLLLLEFRDWLADTEALSFDALVVDRTIDIVGEARRRLVEAGAR